MYMHSDSSSHITQCNLVILGLSEISIVLANDSIMVHVNSDMIFHDENRAMKKIRDQQLLLQLLYFYCV